ncbi:hypothetical protein EWM64_g6858 [Hericium alpestre]|uniref:Transcription factor CBF/NF-Y/archaeal histone domain-containing protein n=1 Tax=Hericium alpestre TaxID=135208 RepID=A0A4Y9ZSZ3_9AGAM|nr:hypothetical protein EWM64_g6858 [Hericium alpestre]
MKNRNKTTKFPVARIKKIMQKDEEVGKVAQATPIVISKALELFLQMIIGESSRVTTSRGSKKVEAYHLKHAVETTEMLDFLKEIVENVPDPSQGGTINIDMPDRDAAGSTSTGKRSRKGKKAAAADDGEGGAPAPKRRRRKKAEIEATRKAKDEEEEEEEMPQAGGFRRQEETWDDEDGYEAPATSDEYR